MKKLMMLLYLLSCSAGSEKRLARKRKKLKKIMKPRNISVKGSCPQEV
jgi:hypothetical protein